MKKLQLKDLTPEILEEIAKMNVPSEVVEHFAKKDLEISEKAAETLLAEAKKGELKLDEESLKNVAGGCGGGRRTDS